MVHEDTKIFMNFSCLNFLAQNALILPDQDVLIPFMNNVYILGILEQSDTESYTWILNIVQNVLILCRPKWFNYFCKWHMYWEYWNSLA